MLLLIVVAFIPAVLIVIFLALGALWAASEAKEWWERRAR